MTLRHLKVFVTVCDCGSITQAAEKLYISQPAISASIKNLEQYYKVKLFDRISRKLYLTEFGKQFLDQSRHIVSLHEAMEQNIDTWKTGGILKVGSSITIGNHLLPYYIKLFKNKYNKVTVHVAINSSETIENMILKNEIDIALIEGVSHSNKIISSVLMDDELTVICGKDHPYANVERITLDQLISSKLLLREKGSGTRELIDTTLLYHNAIAEPLWESVSTQALVNAVRLGIGISILPHRLVANDLENNTIHRLIIKDVSFKRKFHLIHHVDKYISNTTQAFIDLCSNCDMDTINTIKDAL